MGSQLDGGGLGACSLSGRMRDVTLRWPRRWGLLLGVCCGVSSRPSVSMKDELPALAGEDDFLVPCIHHTADLRRCRGDAEVPLAQLHMTARQLSPRLRLLE